MYLNLLSKKEQEDFLELARYSMGLNGEYKNEEEEILLNYKFECHLVEYKAYRQEDIENIIVNLSKSSKQIKKVIFIEIFGILLADGEICEDESIFVQKLTSVFQFEAYEVKRLQRWVEAMNDIVQEGHELIGR